MFKIEKLKYLLFLPSFYGFITLTLTYFLYNLSVIELGPLSLITHSFVLISIFAFLFSTLIFYRLNLNTLSNYTIPKVKVKKMFIFFLYSLSTLGVFLYLKEFINYFGGIESYFFILFSDMSSELRANSEIGSDSIGIQLTYFGWIAIGLNTYYLLSKRISKFWLMPFLLTFLSNFLFIDRTRPMWLIMIIAFVVFYFKVKHFTLIRIVKRLIILTIFFFVIFLLIGNVAGKTSDEKAFKGWNVSSNIQNIVFYLTSSYFYLDYIIVNNKPDYKLDRTIYPGIKVLNLIGLYETPPKSLINEFYGKSFQTNVGTYLEPFYNDFGMFYMLFGILVHSIFLNMLAIFFLKLNTAYSIFVLSNLCIVNFFAFFTPKLNNFPIWFFLFIGIILYFIKQFSQVTNEKKEGNIFH